MKKTQDYQPFYINFVQEKKPPRQKKEKQEKPEFSKAQETIKKVYSPKKVISHASVKKSLALFFTFDKKNYHNENTILENFDKILHDLYPLSSKQLSFLPQNVKRLSHLLTDERNERLVTYMNNKSHLSAYTHYFMWWNLLRLFSIFAGFSPAAFAFLQDGSSVLDIGSGTLTLPIALWLARPELRKKNLTFYCMDISASSLAVGKDIFTSIVAKTKKDTDGEWKVITIKGTFGEEIRKKIDFVTSSNMFNEMLWTCQNDIEHFVEDHFNKMRQYTNEKTAFFIAEPGIPLGGRFISHLRNVFLKNNFAVHSPCPHQKTCCMAGKKTEKWCHFVLHSENVVPKKLEAFSKKCGLPKDRASISFIFTSNFSVPAQPTKESALLTRITSDIIYLPENKLGRYACSSFGLVLLIGSIQKYSFGDLLEIDLPKNFSFEKLPVDKKSKAKMIFV
ncbi:MAG: small ribosomal subunit Rsm22 family protein [Treponemataceae bacterium]